jgi:hypothetical protein
MDKMVVYLERLNEEINNVNTYNMILFYFRMTNKSTSDCLFPCK